MRRKVPGFRSRKATRLGDWRIALGETHVAHRDDGLLVVCIPPAELAQAPGFATYLHDEAHVLAARLDAGTVEAALAESDARWPMPGWTREAFARWRREDEAARGKDSLDREAGDDGDGA